MPPPSAYTHAQHLARLEASLTQIEERVERLERIVLSINKCIKIIWAILVPIIVAFILRQAFHP